MRSVMVSLAAGALVLAGCASTGKYESNIDFEKVARIENAAKAVGVQVFWVNYPQKSASRVN